MRSIIFDLFDTLLDKVSFDYFLGLDYLYERYIDKKKSKEQLLKNAEEFREKNMMDRNETNKETSFIRQLEYFEKNLGFCKDTDKFEIEWDFFQKCRKEKLGDKVVETLKYLNKHGFELFVLSNSIFSAKTLRRYLAQFKVDRYFVKVFSSADLGNRKPSQECFNQVLQSINAKVNDITFFVGNNYEKDIVGANSVNLKTIYYQRNHISCDSPTIHKIHELVAYLENNYIYVNNILPKFSMVDGPGMRTVVFLQGCDMRCKGCHNQNSWSEAKGELISIEKLADEIGKRASNKKITISGGEPLCQETALKQLLIILEGYDICLYTSRQKENVSQEILDKLRYVKVGEYVEKQKTTTMAYLGSTNQNFIKLR